MTFNLSIVELEPEQEGGFAPRGGVAQLWRSRVHEVILSGPAETGKTFGCLHKLDALLWKYSGAQAVMIRKTLTSLYLSCFQTYKKIIGADRYGAGTRASRIPDCTIRFYGGEKPEWADYPNGSRLFFAGMDNPQKALSSERDFIYINQAEELALDDWETLTTRCTGRAANAPYAQIFGDCNPGQPQHWIKQRASLLLLESRHEDNPTLYDAQGHLTERGRKTMEVLDALTGVRKERLRHGRWVSAEGVVYDAWDRAVHLVDRFEIPVQWRHFRVVDFGYTNPFVCQWWAQDDDGRLYLYREIYRTQRLVRDHGVDILRLSAGERIECTVADHDAEDRATLAAGGIETLTAFKSISPGIQAVQRRLQRAASHPPRLFILRDSLTERDESLADSAKPICTEQEFDGYVWPKSQDGRPIKEDPVKVNDHGMDAMRYLVAYVDNIAGGWINDASTLEWLLKR